MPPRGPPPARCPGQSGMSQHIGAVWHRCPRAGDTVSIGKGDALGTHSNSSSISASFPAQVPPHQFPLRCCGLSRLRVFLQQSPVRILMEATPSPSPCGFGIVTLVPPGLGTAELGWLFPCPGSSLGRLHWKRCHSRDCPGGVAATGPLVLSRDGDGDNVAVRRSQGSAPWLRLHSQRRRDRDRRARPPPPPPEERDKVLERRERSPPAALARPRLSPKAPPATARPRPRPFPAGPAPAAQAPPSRPRPRPQRRGAGSDWLRGARPAPAPLRAVTSGALPAGE